ncbi:MAG TPA: methyltransferase domain-containing protein [Chitinophaga sp.]|uniref:class I SAM-dependent methyltransferase n=1 Tax=Chitinophaga sp. TaxID=1869181 RepID=UPI002C44A1F8|nr:methyltransferase domain-containing protein [Chitinophaga sp.]HVI48827.1 methyltransferase domain-containing protein [Chitinophaga sp.]
MNYIEQEKATGWDFSYLTNTGRMAESPLPWNYFVTVCRHLSPGNTILDLGTGGGELLSLLPDKDQLHIYATEGYEPNVPVAEARLRTFGATLVADYSDDELPFEDNYFDVIIDRHESYNLTEIYRVLKPGGFFITQQVDGRSDLNIADVILAKGNKEYLHWDLSYALREFADTAFHIRMQQEDNGFTRFYDTQALLFYIKSMPYVFEDYDQFDFPRISALLNDYFATHGYLDIRKDRFIIVAQK